MTTNISLPGLALVAFLYVIPAVQVLLTISGQYRRCGLLLSTFPYLEHWPVASDAVFAILFALPILATLSGDPFDALYYVPIYALHQLLWLKRRRAKATPRE